MAVFFCVEEGNRTDRVKLSGGQFLTPVQTLADTLVVVQSIAVQ
jgi:hypothetical protein